MEDLRIKGVPLEPGDLVWVKFGGFGKQLAIVSCVTAAEPRVRMYKWRDNSRRWTNRVFLNSSAVIGHLQPFDEGSPVVLRARAELGPQLGVYPAPRARDIRGEVRS